MFQVPLRQIATVATLGLCLLLSGGVRAEQARQAGAMTVLEVRVLDVQTPPGSGRRDAVRYRMEVISVLRATSRVKPGDTIAVRAEASRKDALDAGVEESKAPPLLTPGWMGVAYLNPDPQAGGPEAQFVIAANGDSFEALRPGPPSVQWTQPVEGSAQ